MAMKSRRKTSCWIILVFPLLFIFGIFVREVRCLTIEEEKKLGKKVLLEVEKSMPLVMDPTLQSFVDTLGDSLVKAAGPTPFDFKFHIVNMLDPNAFAIPGGHVFVSTGLLSLAENADEVAGVLGHEIGHVTQRHVSQLLEKSKWFNIASLAAMIAGALVGGGGGQALSSTAMATTEAFALKYTREHEVDADQTGLHIILRAGYDPTGLISFLKKIYKISLVSSFKVPIYLSTHPAIEDRIALLENLLQLGPKPTGPFKVIENFRRVQTKAFVEEREPHVAVTQFESRAKTNPEDVDAFFGLGLAFQKMGRFDKALEAFQTARSLTPNDPDILRELGIAHFLSGRVDLSIEMLEAMRSAGSDNLSGIYYLGRGYQEKGRLDQALQLYLKVREGMPEFPDIYYHMGSVYGRMGQKGLSHFYFGKNFKLRGERKNAVLHFRTALELLDKGSPERKETEQEIKELVPAK